MGRFFNFILVIDDVNLRSEYQITSIKNRSLAIIDAFMLLYKPLGLK